MSNPQTMGAPHLADILRRISADKMIQLQDVVEPAKHDLDLGLDVAVELGHKVIARVSNRVVAMLVSSRLKRD